jgi:uncharacterized phage protein gp47/JayE
MAFQPRNFEQILADMIAHIRANTTLTDFTVGSVIRTLLEAAALEDDEQYFQMVQLLDAFRVQTARDTDLDERGADYNLVRLGAKSAYTDSIVFQNGGLVTDTLTFDIVSGGPVVMQLGDTSDFPVAPFTVRIGEGTPQVEDLSITLNDTTLNQLTATTVVNDHSAGERVSVTGGGDTTVSSGQQIQVPAQGNESAIVFTTQDTATIIDGNYESGKVAASATVPGREGNVSAGRISQFQGSPPFAGALVINKSATQGGRDLESDTDFRARILRRLEVLSRGTPSALESGVIGVEDPQTGQRVTTAKLREDFLDEFNNQLFIDDGTGFTPTSVDMAQSTLSAGVGIGVSALPVNDVTDFPDGGTVLIDPAGASPELIEYSSKGAGNFINLDTPTTAAHLIGVEVLLMDVLGTAEEGQNFFQLADYPVKKNTLELYDDELGTFALQDGAGVDYIDNRTNGEIQYTGAGKTSGTQVIARYGYYTGLVEVVQKTVTGDPEDRVNYPGIAAGGIIIHVATPVIRRITVTATIAAKAGFDESEVREEVRREIEAYIESLKIGDNVFIAKIVERAMRVTGMENVIIQIPSSDIVVLEDELPVPSDINGNTLVTVL